MFLWGFEKLHCLKTFCPSLSSLLKGSHDNQDVVYFHLHEGTKTALIPTQQLNKKTIFVSPNKAEGSSAFFLIPSTIIWSISMNSRFNIFKIFSLDFNLASELYVMLGKSLPTQLIVCYPVALTSTCTCADVCARIEPRRKGASRLCGQWLTALLSFADESAVSFPCQYKQTWTSLTAQTLHTLSLPHSQFSGNKHEPSQDTQSKQCCYCCVQ